MGASREDDMVGIDGVSAIARQSSGAQKASEKREGGLVLRA